MYQVGKREEWWKPAGDGEQQRRWSTKCCESDLERKEGRGGRCESINNRYGDIISKLKLFFDCSFCSAGPEKLRVTCRGPECRRKLQKMRLQSAKRRSRGTTRCVDRAIGLASWLWFIKQGKGSGVYPLPSSVTSFSQRLLEFLVESNNAEIKKGRRERYPTWQSSLLR